MEGRSVGETEGTRARYLLVGRSHAVFEVSAACIEGREGGNLPQELQESGEAGYPYRPTWAEHLSIRYERSYGDGYVVGFRHAHVEGRSADLMLALHRLTATAAWKRPHVRTALEGVYAVGQLRELRVDSAPGGVETTSDTIEARLRRRFGRFAVEASRPGEDRFRLRDKLKLLLTEVHDARGKYGDDERRATFVVPPGDTAWLEDDDLRWERIDERTVVVEHAAVAPEKRIRVHVVQAETLASALHLVLGDDAEALLEEPSSPTPRRAAVRPWTIVAALSLGSGELVWWPYLAAKYGLWSVAPLVTLAALLQWPINYAVGCHALGMKETSLVGFYRASKPFGLFMYVLFTLAFLPFVAYAYLVGAAAAAVLPAFAITPAGDAAEATRAYSVVCILVAFVVTLKTWRRPRMQQNVSIVILTLAFAIVLLLVFGGTHPAPAPKEHLAKLFTGKDVRLLVNAVIFMGLGGFWNLLYSVWLLDADAPRGAGGRERRRSRLRRDAGLAVLANLALTLLLCWLADIYLMAPTETPTLDDLTRAAAKDFPGWHLAQGRYLYLLLVVAGLWDTLFITTEVVSAMHVRFLEFLRAARKIGDAAVKLLGKDGIWVAIAMYVASSVLVVVTLDRRFAVLPEEMNLLNGYVHLLGMPFCCAGLLLVQRRLWPHAGVGASDLRPGRMLGALVAVAGAIYAVLGLVAILW